MKIPYKRKNLEWRTVKGYSGLYLVSNYGDIIRKEKKFVDKAGKHQCYPEKIFWNEEQAKGGGSHGDDYLMVNLNGDRRYSHRIAAQAF